MGQSVLAKGEFRRGRPTTCTPELIQEICQLITDGNYITTSCGVVGIADSTYRNWLMKARKGAEPYLTFATELQKAFDAAETRLIRRIDAAGDKSWQANAWILERTRQDRFGQSQQVNVTVTHHAADAPPEPATDFQGWLDRTGQTHPQIQEAEFYEESDE